MPWARASGMVLEELPKVKGVGRANAAVLNHWFSLDWAEPSRSAMVPVRLGRWPPPKELLVLVATLIGSGLPDWCVTDPKILEKGLRGARAAGFFSNDWLISANDSCWEDAP